MVESNLILAADIKYLPRPRRNSNVFNVLMNVRRTNNVENIILMLDILCQHMWLCVLRGFNSNNIQNAGKLIPNTDITSDVSLVLICTASQIYFFLTMCT